MVIVLTNTPILYVQFEVLVIIFTFKHFDCHCFAGSSFVNPKCICFYDLAKSSTSKRFTLKWEHKHIHLAQQAKVVE